ncbi:acetyl-CoA C-acyltransferase [Sporosarcina sp. P21c]|uniref:thiolase family protein n=1 Tax=unclassified Sporosarcina TaxID=2647733 RepID=UPI000C16A289|nr:MULTISPECIES: thiolase family protein [unclassified Sporosarcina]PIC66162.1 acetyl-CoA C-acyltransferase [Sporosarcina sp. P16a]PIC88803.1 acetyl-CoA C-acyltransferase [Sporosarcina sp. P21c]PIC91826.1 acetyl-CoA C-acyltransferase [Sporosarcina sp. P25]
MIEVVIVDGVRTAVGRRKGALSSVRSDELAATVLKELVKKTGIHSSQVEDVIMGCGSQVGEQSMNIARTSALIAGFPIEVPGITLDRQCGSGQQAIHFAAQAIASGDMDIVIAGGVENMTRVPMFSSVGESKPSKKLTSKYEIVHQGISAEKVAEKYGLTRKEIDEYSSESHDKAIKAIAEGYFDEEIIPITVSLDNDETMVFEKDEGPREGSTVEVLGNLKPVFQEDGIITAGNSSQMSDGAAAVLIMSADKAKELGLKPKARIVAKSVVGSDPTLMLTGPVAATQKVLKKAGLTIEDIDTYEVNEAFAPVPIMWLKEIGADPEKLNPDGGAVALGHPIGATGAKLMITLMNRLQRTGGRYGLLSICEGMGMANATIIERID